MYVGGSQALDGSLEVPEPLHCYDGSNLASGAARFMRHVHHYQPAGPGDGFQDGLFVQRHQGTGVKHLSGDAFLRQGFGRR